MSNQPSPNSVGKFFGFVLMACAALWMAFCGLCTLGILATVFTESGSAIESIPSLLFVLVITGVGVTGGYAVFNVGRNLWRA